jgi:hypothetical protein
MVSMHVSWKRASQRVTIQVRRLHAQAETDLEDPYTVSDDGLLLYHGLIYVPHRIIFDLTFSRCTMTIACPATPEYEVSAVLDSRKFGNDLNILSSWLDTKIWWTIAHGSLPATATNRPHEKFHFSLLFCHWPGSNL